jgi:hypothetical protein
MPRPHQPDPEPDRGWASWDDPPPGVSIRPLGQGDLAALLAHLDQHAHPQHVNGPVEPTGPVLAVRVRASVGRPGASAQAEYRRRRAAESAAWVRSLPWRAAVVLAVGLAVGLLVGQLALPLAGPAGLLVGAALAWLLRFHPSIDTLAWRRGVRGERRTARLLAPLERHGWAVLHDLAIPSSQANIDHLVIGPGGVLVIDSKQYRGRLWLDADGLLWHGRHLLISTLRRVLWEADQADEVLGVAEVQVAAIMAVHGAAVPWGRVDTDGVTVIPVRRLPDLLGALPPILGPERVAWLADRARLRFRAAD